MREKISGRPAGPQPARVPSRGSAHFLARPSFQFVLHLLSFQGQTGITGKAAAALEKVTAKVPFVPLHRRMQTLLVGIMINYLSPLKIG